MSCKDKAPKGKSKHYTIMERKVFLQILQEYKHVIEVKKSDSTTLKDKECAWSEICNKYNQSTLICEERTVQQLKKLWTNLKQSQRDALTKEKQSRMATGGGLEEAEATIDPDILTIVPHLMKTAPVFFSSNMTETEVNDKREVIFDAISTQKMEILDIDNESSIEDDNSGSLFFIETEGENKSSTEINMAQDSSVMATKSEKESTTLCGSLKKSVSIPKRKRDNIKGKNREIELLDIEKKLKIQRVQQVMSEEAELARIRQTHEEKIFKMKEEHLREMNNMQLQHLKEIHAIEIQINRTKLKSIDCLFKDKENHPYV